MSIDNGITDETWVITYDNREIKVEASKRRLFHNLIARDKKGFVGNHPFDVFFRILNEFVWFSDIKVNDLNGGHGEYCANLNFLVSSDSYLIRLEKFRQQVTTEEQHLALGFFREGLSSGSAFYEFICYAKILEMPFKNGKAKSTWIDKAINGLRDNLALTVRDRKIAMLDGKSLEKWLREDGRNALAHAKLRGGKTVRDPNSFKDWDEIKWGNTVMRELAEKVIVEELQIPVGDAARTY
jgi:hypothetical protein